MARELSLEEVLKASFQSQLSNQWTAIPCIVVGVNLDSQMVDIQPTINQRQEDGTVLERSPVLGVPVSFPTSKTAGFSFPISVGDTGLAVFSMRNMDGWKAGNGRPSSPLNFAKMDKSDAVFLPGIQPPSVAVNNPSKHVFPHSNQDTVIYQNLGSSESEVRLKLDGSIEINTSGQPVVINCSEATINASTSMNINSPAMIIDVETTTWIGNIVHQGDYAQTGNYTLVGGQATFNGVVFNTHRHAPSTVPPTN